LPQALDEVALGKLVKPTKARQALCVSDQMWIWSPWALFFIRGTAVGSVTTLNSLCERLLPGSCETLLPAGHRETELDSETNVFPQPGDGGHIGAAAIPV
jgi:hypothetical protein